MNHKRCLWLVDSVDGCIEAAFPASEFPIISNVLVVVFKIAGRRRPFSNSIRSESAFKIVMVEASRTVSGVLGIGSTGALLITLI